MRAANTWRRRARSRKATSVTRKAQKTPDGLLKLGMSLARADQKPNACVALAKLGEEGPRAAASVRQRATSEMKNAGLLTADVRP